jgi:5-formyltetrahydrofolate cyclo-ligase
MSFAASGVAAEQSPPGRGWRRFAPIVVDVSASTLAEEKRTLRETLARRLVGIDPREASLAAAAAAERFLALPEIVASRRVLVCLSFGTEIATQPVIAALEASGREIFIPRADPADRQLHIHAYPCELVTLSFGLCQPARGTPEVPAESLDTALVLGLAFDEHGIRLGHGRAYFDRFLARHPVAAIGFAYERQVVPSLPREPHDVPMSALVTESATRRFPTAR